MSRYRKTMREALEEVQQNMAFEGKMKDIYTMQQTGASPKEIAKKMGLPLSTVKDILGEEHTISEFTRKDFDRNEDENEHTLNSYMLAKKYGDSSEKSKMTRLYNKTRKVGSFLTKAENDYVTMIQSKYYRRLEHVEDVQESLFTVALSKLIKKAKSMSKKDFIKNYLDTAIVPGAKKLDKDSLSKTWDLYNLNMSMHEEEELKEYFATVHSKKPEIVKFINANKKNIDYVDIDAGSNIEFEGKGAHELADKVKSRFGVRVTKEETEEVELNDIDENFSPAMITKLKKAYGPLKGKKIAPGGLMKIFDKIDKNKNALIQLFKADIPFVSQMAASRLISKHNMKGVEINKLREELELDEQIKTFNRNALTPLEKSELAKHFDKLANTGTTTEKPYYRTLVRYVMGNIKPFEFNDMIGGAPTHVLGSINRNVMKIIGKAKAKSFIPGFKEEVELDELQNYSRQLKDPSKEMMVVDKQGKVSVIDKKEFEKYRRQGYMAAEELDKDDTPTVKKVVAMLKKASKAHASQAKDLSKSLTDETEVDELAHVLKEFNPNFGKDAKAGRGDSSSGERDKVVKDQKDKEAEIQSLKNDIAMLKTKLENEKNKAIKPEPNPDTGEVPLTVGVAYKVFKDQEKKDMKKEKKIGNKSEMREKYLGERAYRIKFDNVDGAIGNREADAVQADLKKMGFSASVSLSDINKNELYFNTGVEKNQMKRLLTKAGYDLDEAVIAGKDYKYDGKGPIKISRLMYNKLQRDSKSMVKGKPYMMALNPKTQGTELVPVEFTEDLDEGKFTLPTRYVVVDTRTNKVTHASSDDKDLKLDVGRKSHLKIVKLKKPVSQKKTGYLLGEPLKAWGEEVDLEEADLTDKQVKMVKKVAEKLPMKDFKKRYGKDAMAVKFGTATNMVKKKLNIDHNDKHAGARQVVESIKAVKNKAEKTGMPYSILKQVYDRGMAAWKGGHRPGATQVQWALARVNSFVTKSSGTWGGADKDLAKKVRAAKK